MNLKELALQLSAITVIANAKKLKIVFVVNLPMPSTPLVQIQLRQTLMAKKSPKSH
jgi:hypothetical protein